MNKLIVIAKNKNTYFLHQLRKQMNGSELFFLDPWDKDWGEELFYGDPSFLVRSTGVYGDNRDLELIDTLMKQGYQKFFNSLECLKVCRRKSTQFKFFHEIGIPCLPWFHLDQINSMELLGFFSKNSDRPYLIKPDRGQGGIGIEVVSERQIINRKADQLDLDFIVQPYINGAEEFRVFFIKNNEPITLRREKTPHAIAANFRQNGSAEWTRTPEFISEILQKLLIHLPMHYGALDILKIKNQYWVLEVNSAPGIEQLEMITGKNITRLLLESF